MRIHSHSSIMVRRAFGLFVLMMGVVLFSSMAPAQLTRSARIELNDLQQISPIGPDSYITADPQKTLSYQSMINRHENNLRGARQNTNIINLNDDSNAVWLLFSVTNNTQQSKWLLDFGDVFDGRTAISNAITLHDADGRAALAYDVKNDSSNIGRVYNRRAIPLRIENGQTKLFAAHIEIQFLMGRSLSPYLISADHYVERSFLRDKMSSVFFALFFAGIIGAFLTISYVRQNINYLGFCVYYLLNAGLFYSLSHVFTSPFGLWAPIWLGVFVSTTIIGAFFTKSFLRIGAEARGSNIALMGCAAFAILGLILSLFLLASPSILSQILIYAPAGLMMALLFTLSFVKGQDGQYGGFPYAAGWAIILFGLVISALSSLNIFPQNTLYLNAYWLALFPQALLFILGVKRRIKMLEEEKKHKRSRESRAIQSQARLKHSKESADQARLLRVIERERELMTELREREIQRTEEMRVAKETAVDANRAKSAFLAVVSHEIRTPMTGILGILRLLGDTALNQEQKDYLLSIQTSGDTMMALLNDILDFEKIERGAMDLEEIDIDLPKLVQGVVTLMSGHAADKGLSLRAEISDSFPQYLIGDPTRLRQILLNLVNNAIKFTQQGEVIIHLQAKPAEGMHEHIKADYEIYIAVEDTGIGISEEAQSKLFSPFEQADNTVARRFGGTGLGLAICKRLVEAMGGAISIESTEGEGSTFFFSIFMDSGLPENAAQQEQSGAYIIDLPPMDILIVEDNEINAKVLVGFLKKGGHTPFTADSGERAIEMAKEQNFDAIFTDINLKGITGMDVAAAVRALPDSQKSKTPIIAISGNVSDEDVAQYEAAGMNGFIPKPIIPEALYAALQNIQTPGKAEDETSEHAEENVADDNIAAPHNTEPQAGALDQSIIQGLLDSLGAEAFKGLIDSYIEKADELIDDLAALQDSDDIAAIRDRAHELKGMAANFGVQETSQIAGEIEDAAVGDDLEGARLSIKKLPDVNRRAKEAIAELLKD